jgi:hypothetical protein
MIPKRQPEIPEPLVEKTEVFAKGTNLPLITCLPPLLLRCASGGGLMMAVALLQEGKVLWPSRPARPLLQRRRSGGKGRS